MKLRQNVIHELAVRPGAAAGLGSRSTTGTRTDWLGSIGHASPKDVAEHDLEVFKQELESAQELLYASDTWALLLIFQALDAAGKDGTIKHVMSGVNPQGCEVVSFKQPSAEELRHDFLWRCAGALPERGRIGIFNRSYYEEVLVVRVHPELIAQQNLPHGTELGAPLWRERYEDINAFEQHLARNGTRSSSSSWTFPKASNDDDSSPAWTTQPNSGSSRRATSPSGRTSTTTSRPTSRP